MRVKWGNVIFGFLLVWLIIILYMLGPLWQSSADEERLAKKLHEARNEITRLSGENYELRTMLKKLQQQSQQDHVGDKAENVKEMPEIFDKKQSEVKQKDDLNQYVTRVISGPSKEYEMLRRQIFKDTNEMWWFVRSRLGHVMGKFGKDNQELNDWINNTLIGMLLLWSSRENLWSDMA